MREEDIQVLKSWFKKEARSLPWRQNPTPYGVWVSEVMLQQTRVAVVIPYYLRWMERFPTIEALAKASVEEVLKYWEGLGYYSRARRLYAGAQQVMHEFGGELPADPVLLAQISGLGPYTIGAIRSFAFHCKAAAVDGNVLRVLARYYGIEEEIDKGSTILHLRNKAEALLPQEEPWVISEALIELGATMCQRQAMCELCPLHGGCIAYAKDLADELPKKRPRAITTLLHRGVIVLKSPSGYLVRRVAENKIMGGLCEFPYLEMNEPLQDVNVLIAWVQREFGIQATFTDSFPVTSHSFTRYKATLYPYLIACEEAPLLSGGYQWHNVTSLAGCVFPSGHRTIAQQVCKG